MLRRWRQIWRFIKRTYSRFWNGTASGVWSEQIEGDLALDYWMRT